VSPLAVSTTPGSFARAMAAALNSQSTRKSQAQALLAFILIMLGLAAGTGWLAARGLLDGETWLPTKRSSQSRSVDRDREPAMFWTAMGIYGILCCGAAGFAGWLAREGLRAPDGVFRRRELPRSGDHSADLHSTHRPAQRKSLTLNQARDWVAQIQSPKERAAASQLLNEAMALPQLSAEERAAAFLRIRALEPVAPDYQLSSFGASVLEIIGESLADPAVKKAIYVEASELAKWYASGASSGGEGTARSRHVREIEAKLQATDAGSRAQSAVVHPGPIGGAASTSPERSHQSSAARSWFLTALGWVFIIAGALLTPVSLISALMIFSGGHGSSGSFFGGLIVIGGPPMTLIAGIGLLRRRRWAYGYALAVLGLFAASSLVQIARGSTPEQSSVSPTGVITTVLASTPSYSLHIMIIAIAVGLLLKLSSRAIRTELASRKAKN
jgi:hypothetical protein